MLKTAALAALVLLDDIKPKAVSRAEKYITDHVPMPPLLQVVRDDTLPSIPVIKAPIRRKPKKKHVCYWDNATVWGAVVCAFVLGAFIGFCI